MEDGEADDWSGHVEEDTQNFAMMAYYSSNSGSDNEVQSCSKTCFESYARLKKLYDKQRDKLGDASVEITAYTLALKKSVFMNKECDLENTPINDRYVEGMHAVPPHMTGNYMPSGPDVEIDYSKFTYGPKQTSANESDSKPIEFAFSESDSSADTTTSMPLPVDNAPMIVCQPKVENVKKLGTPNQCLKIEKHDRHSHTRKGLGYARKSCFVCGNFSHLIRDYDFHEKRMAKQAALTKSKEKGTGQHAHRPVWNNVTRVNQQNKFVPTAVLTKTGKIPVNAAKQNFSRQATLTSTASKINTARTFVNNKTQKKFYKSHSPHKRPFHKKTAQRNTLKTQKVNTVNTSLSVVKGNKDTAAKASAGNKAHLVDYQEFKGGSIAFGGSNGRITGKGTIKASRLDFKDVYYVEELKHYNLFSMSQMCDKKNKVHFTDTDCLVLSLDFKFPNESQEELEKLNRQEKEANDAVKKEATHETQDVNTNSTNLLNVVSTPVSVVGPLRALNDAEPSYPDDHSMPHLEDIYASPSAGIFTNSSYDDEGVVTDFNNLETTMNGFTVYQMDVKSAFMYDTIDEEVYVTQPPRFVDPKYPNKVYKVVKALYGLHQAPRAFQVTPKTSHLQAMKRIFRYLKGQPKLGLWYPKVSSFDLEAYSDSDYVGANLDRESTTGEAEYVAAAHCRGQVLWILKQLLDYGFNLMNTKIYIDNESTICIVKYLVFHSKTKHIEIPHHFIMDAYEKKLI
nr:hypothetical protein [Tanacetum cinerariifolium]